MTRRGIPPVRTWRVRYHMNRFEPFPYRDVLVDTINKRFALWEASDRTRGEPWAFRVVRTTVSLVKGEAV